MHTYKKDGRTVYTVSYAGIGGVDLTSGGRGISRSRLAYAENLYRDYSGDGGDAIESIPGFRKVAALGARINGIHARRRADGTTEAILHAGTGLYRLSLSAGVGSPSLLAQAKDTKSHAFPFGDRLFLLDGSALRVISDTGCDTVGTGVMPYIPTISLGGEPYEQRNLLTNQCREEYHIGSSLAYAAASDGIRYRIDDPSAGTCCVSGYEAPCPAEVYIPARVRIGDTEYHVSAIADGAFRGATTLTTFTAAEGLGRVGSLAFYACKALTSVRLPDSVTEIGDAALANCDALDYLRFGIGMQKLGAGIVAFCPALSHIHYGGTQEDYAAIVGSDGLPSTVTPVYDIPSRGITIDLPLSDHVSTIDSVTIGGENVTFTPLFRGEKAVGVRMTFSDRSDIEGRTVILNETLSASGDGFLALHPPAEGEGDPIRACRICECFDGRIFLAGNPRYPNTIFYAARTAEGEIDPLYFGTCNFFTDGVGQDSVTAMLAVGDRLAVFKSGDDGTGSIFYHEPKDSGEDLIPRIYPVSYVHSGTVACGEAISFRDDPVFLSEAGVCALDRADIRAERSIAVRSHPVNPALLSEDLASATLTVFDGYLVLCAGERFYLADSRALFTHPSGYREYEWFCLSGIGTYKDSTRVYRYAASAPDGYAVYAAADEKTDKTVYADSTGEETIYFVYIDGKKCAVYPTEERQGGTFSPAVVARSVGDLLLFGTASGDVCVFNTDKRGAPPPGHETDPAYTSDAYRAAMGRRLHPAYYDFCGHAPRYALKTRADDCDIPHLAKDSVRRSLVIQCRAGTGGHLTVEVGTDRTGYREGCELGAAGLSFADLDFGEMALLCADTVIAVLNEREKNWVEKQIAISSDAFRSPIAILSLHYRFTVRGDIRTR